MRRRATQEGHPTFPLEAARQESALDATISAMQWPDDAETSRFATILVPGMAEPVPNEPVSVLSGPHDEPADQSCHSSAGLAQDLALRCFRALYWLVGFDGVDWEVALRASKWSEGGRV